MQLFHHKNGGHKAESTLIIQMYKYQHNNQMEKIKWYIKYINVAPKLIISYKILSTYMYHYG